MKRERERGEDRGGASGSRSDPSASIRTRRGALVENILHIPIRTKARPCCARRDKKRAICFAVDRKGERERERAKRES